MSAISAAAVALPSNPTVRYDRPAEDHELIKGNLLIFQHFEIGEGDFLLQLIEAVEHKSERLIQQLPLSGLDT
jgi:hypothetical protein